MLATKTDTIAPPALKVRSRRKKNDNLTGYLFILPFVIGFIGLTLFPTVASLYLSFTDYNMLGSPHWIGIDNFREMFTQDDTYWQSVRVTLQYVFTAVPVRLVCALLIAMLLDHITAGAGFFRTVLYVPSLIGGSVAVSVMWKQLFSDKGAINALLTAVGLRPLPWLGDPHLALWTLVLLAGWQFGSPMLVFLAGLKNIPRELYEAASVDGANAWQKFVRITLPMLTPVILFNVVMQVIQAFLAFTPSYIISNGHGDPLNGTLLYVLYLFRNAFEFFKMGYASAMAWVLLAVIALCTALIFRSSSYWVHYESESE
ncbi:MAG: sugar ABC transporter permease [Alicyclobacillus macrosporangiidus]|uniref:carbohydrate ABC transporter permease n=1 Tax=Alicyclobacillus macrosporangiidus TaxID=392015 RepID=UPI0026EB3DBB|nr:sugar ABC transporter permease [Alicyclobacillus macrosporangiidus]MCL6597201.1 sugar ABC transporter permease [Alicyclobacillus macrosporangiidus]